MLAWTVEVPLPQPRSHLRAEVRRHSRADSIEPARPRPAVRIWSQLGNEKTAQFPELVKALKTSHESSSSVVLDGEIVALDEKGEPSAFSACRDEFT